MLFNAGDQFPIIPLVEVVGNAANVPPEQIGFTCVNVGVTFGFTVMVIVAVVAQTPVVGVNVYVVVALLFSNGDQVPVIALFEVVGNAANVAPKHFGVTCVNVGAVFGFTVTVFVIEFIHPKLVVTVKVTEYDPAVAYVCDGLIT